MYTSKRKDVLQKRDKGTMFHLYTFLDDLCKVSKEWHIFKVKTTWIHNKKLSITKARKPKALVVLLDIWDRSTTTNTQYTHPTYFNKICFPYLVKTWMNEQINKQTQIKVYIQSYIKQKLIGVLFKRKCNFSLSTTELLAMAYTSLLSPVFWPQLRLESAFQSAFCAQGTYKAIWQFSSTVLHFNCLHLFKSNGKRRREVIREKVRCCFNAQT